MERSRFLSSLLARPGRWAALLGVALCLPSLGVGLRLDDHLQRAAARGELGHAAAWDLFAFVPGDLETRARLLERGVLGWWADPDLRIAFGRPLTSLTHAIDHAFLGTAAWAMHAENLVLYGVLCLLFARLAARLLPSSRAAGLAALLYAVDQGHGTAVGWIAARNALLVALFGVLALLLHARWRQEGWKAGALLAPLALTLALLSGESGLGVLGFLAAFALFLDRASRRARLLSLAPHLLATGLWASLYLALGFGFRGGGLYADPLEHPLVYMRALAENLPVYLGGQILSVPTDGAVLAPGLALPLAAAWLLVLALLLRLLLPVLREDATARFLALGSLLALLPAGAAFPQDRHLLFAGLGLVGLVALLADQALDRRLAGPTRVLALLLLALHGVVSPLLLPLRCLSAGLIGGMVERAAGALPVDAPLAGRTVLLVKTPLEVLTWSLGLVPPFVGEEAPSRLLVLSSGMGPATLEGLDERSARLCLEQGWLAAPVNRLFRSAPFEEGYASRVADIELRVERLTSDARPACVRFSFPRTLEDPSLVWTRFEDGALRRFEAPRPGERVEIPAF